MVFHVMGWTPWNSLLQMLGAAGWVYWGIKSGEKAIILNFLPQFFIIIPGLIILDYINNIIRKKLFKLGTKFLMLKRKNSYFLE